MIKIKGPKWVGALASALLAPRELQKKIYSQMILQTELLNYLVQFSGETGTGASFQKEAKEKSRRVLEEINKIKLEVS